MKRISVAVLLVGLFFAGAAVQAIHNPLDKAKKVSKKLASSTVCAINQISLTLEISGN